MQQLAFEIKSHRKSFIIWALNLLIFILLIFVEFSAYRDNPQLLEILEVFPPEMLIALGMQGTNLTTVSGFTSVTLVYMQLALAIYASLLGVMLVGKETRGKTADFLYVLPHSRQKVIMIKLCAGFLLVSALTLVVGLSYIGAAQPYDPPAYFTAFIIRTHIALLLTSLVFYATGFMLSATLKSTKLASSLASVGVFALYLLSMIISLVDRLAWLEPLSVFSWITFPDLISEGIVTLPVFIGSVAWIALCAIISIVVYPRHDLGTFR